MAMVRSSTTLARTNSGLPLPLHADEVLEWPAAGTRRRPGPGRTTVDRALVGRAEAQRPAVAPGQPEVAAVPVVARRRVPGRRPCLGPRVDLLPGAAAGVERAAAHSASMAAWCAAPWADWKYGPSSGAMPSHVSAAMIPSVHSGRLRSSSVSSIRRTNVPPCWRAKSQLNSAARALPTWKYPVGDGREAHPGRVAGVGHGVRTGRRRRCGAAGRRQSSSRWRWRPSGSR